MSSSLVLAIMHHGCSRPSFRNVSGIGPARRRPRNSDHLRRAVRKDDRRRANVLRKDDRRANVLQPKSTMGLNCLIYYLFFVLFYSL